MTKVQWQQVSAGKIFFWITGYPWLFISLGFILIASFAGFIPGLVKDTRSDAFLPPDEPALIYRNKVKEIFGLTDPIVIAVVNEQAQGVFNPHTLNLVAWLTDKVSQLDNIDPERITSLATENNISGNNEGIVVAPFWDKIPTEQLQADKIRTAIMSTPLYTGSLVADNGNATLIVIEVMDANKAHILYQQLLELVETAPKNTDEQIHIAGEGAVSGYLGIYIDNDVIRLTPLAALTIAIILFAAFRTMRGALLPNIVIVAALASALGTMAAFNVSFFIISIGLLPVLIAISVADSIHIFNHYYEEMIRYPEEPSRDIVIRTMVTMWRPITMTTLTTQAGFLGLYLASVMPPMKYFGLFAIIGVGIAWLFSIIVLPACLSLLPIKTSPVYRSEINKNTIKPDMLGQLLISFGGFVVKRAGLIVAVAVVIAGFAMIAITHLELNEERIRVFQQDEPIAQADAVINSLFDGVHYLDILIETAESEAVFEPENLKRIEALQKFTEKLPHVGGSNSIVDYLKQMHRSLNGGNKEAYILPQDKDLIAQYFLLYSASAEPTDFQEEVDYDYRLANIRISLDSGKYSDEKVVIEATQKYIDRYFNTDTISAHLSGRVNLDYHWIQRLGQTTGVSVAISLFLVWLMAAIAFHSMSTGLITVLPVSLTVLLVYAVMAYSGIWLSISTSMFAAIAIGLCVDFAVHTIDRLKSLLHQQHYPLDKALVILYPTTGRALLFNFMALTLGFGVLVISKVVVLQEFGAIVALAVTVSFIASLTLLPALIKLSPQRFLGEK